MGGIVSSTLPENCRLEEPVSFKGVVKAAMMRDTRELLMASTPGARVRKSLYEKGYVSSVDDFERRIDSFNPDCVYEKIDMNDPFKKRGLLMQVEVQQRFEQTFSEMFFYEMAGQNACRDRLLLEAAKLEERAKHTIIQSRYVNADTMYLIEKGKAVLSLDKRVVRRLAAPITYLEWLEQGGETKDVDIGPSNASILLYSYERNPVLRCITDSVFWALSRVDFRGIVSLMSIAACVQRSAWLACLPEIASLGRSNIMRLTKNLKSETYMKGDTLYLKNRIGSKLVLLEAGIARIELSPDIVAMKMSRDELDAYMGIIRPAINGRLCVSDMSSTQLIEFMRFHTRQRGEDVAAVAPCENIPVDPYALPVPANICELTPGCIVGASILRGKANYSGQHWNWLNSQFVDELWLGEVGAHGKSVAGAKYPLTLAATTTVRVQSFSVELYEQLFGRIEDVLNSNAEGGQPVAFQMGSTESQLSPEGAKGVAAEMGGSGIFSSSFVYKNFKNFITLRHGTFGEIVVVEYDDSNTLCPETSGAKDATTAGERKTDETLTSPTQSVAHGPESSDFDAEVNPDGVYVIKLSQSTSTIEHIKNEASILRELCHPYIIKFYGLVDASRNLDQSKLAIVSEVLYSGDLWDVLYYGNMKDVLGGDDSGYEMGKGLPLELIQFYSASIVFALDHIHSKNIMYRNLRPENVLLDAKGQIRLVDFVYAKDSSSYFNSQASSPSSSPFSFEKHCRGMRSFTLCGTPEYLAPEMVYGTGHDWAVDLWAFGVLIFELYTARTPFEALDANGEASRSNVAQIFKNIAGNVHHNVLATQLDDTNFKQSPDARNLGAVVQSLCQHDPWERDGYLSGSVRSLLDKRFFDAVELDLVESSRHPAKYLPPCRQSVYKAYVEYIATNKSLVIDDYVQYKMQVPRDESYDSDIDFDDFSDL